MKALPLLLVGLTLVSSAPNPENENPECEALSEMFSASFKSPWKFNLRSRLVDHLRKCPAREGDLPVEYAPGCIIEEESMPVYPLYVAAKNNAEDVAEALLERGKIQLNLTQDTVDYGSGGWGPNAGVGFLYFNPVWAAIDNQQFDLALRIIKSPDISVYGYFKNNSKTKNPDPIPSPSFFIPFIITFFCNSDQAQKNENAMKFCMRLITDFPKNSFKLGSCDGLADHPSWAWSILQTGHLDLEFLIHDDHFLPAKFPFAGKHTMPETRYVSHTCVMDCECAVEVGMDYALKQKDLIQESEMVALSWINSIYNLGKYEDIRRTIVRFLMVNKRYPLVLSILQKQPEPQGYPEPTSYSTPKGFQEKWFDNRFYDEVLLLEAFFYGNDQIIQHYLNNSQHIRPDFLKQLVEIGETSGKTFLGNLFGSGLQVPKENLLLIKSIINGSP